LTVGGKRGKKGGKQKDQLKGSARGRGEGILIPLGEKKKSRQTTGHQHRVLWDLLMGYKRHAQSEP